MNSTSYNYTITRSSTDVFFITMNYSTSVSNRPILTIDLNPPDEILYNTSINQQLTNKKLQASLSDYYFIDASLQAMLSTTSEGTNSLNLAAGNAFAANNLLLGSSFGIKSLISMDIIRFLRYFLIDYPPPVLAMYETSMPTSDLIPNINFDEEEADGTLPDIFIKYKLSIYSFNNNGNIWTETFAYIAVGLCVSFLMKLFKTSKNRYFLLILLICRLVFVWNYALSYFLHFSPSSPTLLVNIIMFIFH